MGSLGRPGNSLWFPRRSVRRSSWRSCSSWRRTLRQRPAGRCAERHLDVLRDVFTGQPGCPRNPGWPCRAESKEDDEIAPYYFPKRWNDMETIVVARPPTWESVG